MKFKAYTGITWSVLELTGLLEDEDSRVYFEKFKKHLGLHPFHLTNLNAALNEILSSNLNSYDPDLKGFLLAYKNPKLLTPLGEIFYDTCFIHVDIEADFYIFKPEVGCTLKGIVNKKGLDHIGILVHKAFNVSIPKPDDEKHWPGDNVEIGQEVRFGITLLDFTSKLPFIRGVLNRHDYLRGCKLMENSMNNRRLSSENNIENNVENPVNRGSEKNTRHTFFATDSENTSDEDVPEIKKEVIHKKKSKKKFEQEEAVEYSEKKKKHKKHDKKDKETNESEFDLIKVETEHSNYMKSSPTNGEVMSYEELEELIDSKSKIKKKSKSRCSQSSIDEDNEEKKYLKYSPNKASRRLFMVESKDGIGKIDSERWSTYSDVEQFTEENTFESKPKIKTDSMKRKDMDDSDSVVEFTTEKYIKSSKSPSKRSSKKIKTEELNDDISEVNVDAQESAKKRHKKRKHSFKLETSESEMDRAVKEDSIKKHSKRSGVLDSELAFQNTNIKGENMIGGFGNTQDEDYIVINEVSKIDPELNVSTCSSNYAVEEHDQSNTNKKKRKKHSKKALLDTSEIKIEPEFEDVVVKVESGFDGVVIKEEEYCNDTYGVTENVYWEQDATNVPKMSTPKKKHQVNLNDSVNSIEEDVTSNTKHLKKKKVKTEKFVTVDESDIDSSAVDVTNTEEKKKRRKSSSYKQLNKFREPESDIESVFDFRNVKNDRFRDS